MENRSVHRRVQRMYAISRKWIYYGSLVLVLAVVYFGNFLGGLAEWLIPAAAVAILGILFETLQSLEKRVSETIEAHEFDDILECLPRLGEIIERDKDTTTIEVLAATGGTTLTHVLPKLIQKSRAKRIAIELHVIHPDGSQARYYPEHWPKEARLTIQRAQDELGDSRTSIRVYKDEYLPPVHGLLVNNYHLVLGFYGWTIIGDARQLSGAQQPHRYLCRSDPNAEYWFGLFEDWLRKAPTERIEA